MSYSTELRNTILDAKNAVIGNGGKLEIYGVTTDVAGTANAEGTTLAVFTLGTPFAPFPVNGVQSPVLPAATTGLAASGAGTLATWARITKADGTTAVMDRTVGLSGSGAHIILSSTTIISGGAVTITSWTITAADA